MRATVVSTLSLGITGAIGSTDSFLALNHRFLQFIQTSWLSQVLNWREGWIMTTG